MHKKFILLRISDLSVFLNGARLACHAKAPDRPVGVNDFPVMGSRVQGGPRVRWGRSTRQAANRGVAVRSYRDRDSAAVAGSRLWPSSVVGSKGSVGLRASVFFGEGVPFSPCAGAALRFGLNGVPLRELRAGPASASGVCSGACLGACLSARARSRRRRLRMSVCPSPSSGDSGPQRGHRSSRGRCRIARFGAVVRGATISSARPTRGRAGHGS